MTNERRPLTGSDASDAGAVLLSKNELLVGIAVVAKRFRHFL
jgi:hypothetical protein